MAIMVVYLPLFSFSSSSIASLVGGDHLLRASHSIGPADNSTGFKVASAFVAPAPRPLSVFAYVAAAVQAGAFASETFATLDAARSHSPESRAVICHLPPAAKRRRCDTMLYGYLP